MESVYSFGSFRGIEKYDIIECSEDQKTLIVKDTTCSNHDNCIIELVKDGDSYILSKLLNESAQMYSCMHKGCRYHESKEYCFCRFLKIKLNILKIKLRTALLK